MPILAWRNDADGFAFENSWTLDPIETNGLTAIAQPVVWSAVATIAAVLPFPDPILLTALGVAANIAIGRISPTVEMGLCGGMAYASLDYWHARAPLPRGAHVGDQPMRVQPSGVLLRDFIWVRLIDSLRQGGALQRTLEWSLLLNQVPSPIGGAGALRTRTVLEWNRVKGSIDAGFPCPIGLIYTGRDVWYQHQILVYGYEDPGNGTGTMYVYDSNTPKQYGDTSHSIVTLDFTGASLVATTPSDATTGTLAGFFCTEYIRVPPPRGLATSFGQFVSWPGDSTSYMTACGARMPISGAAELGALGGSAGDVRSTVAMTSGFARPRDNALFRERSSAPVFLYEGGSPFYVPDPTWLGRFGGWGAVRVVPDGSLAAFVGVPDDGTLLKEWSAPEVFRMIDGKRRWVTDPTELAGFGGFQSVRVVPDGALAGVPHEITRIFLLQTGTALTETDDTFAFAVAPNNDVFAIKKSKTGTNSTEVHVLSAADNYQQFSLQTGTVLPETDETFDYLLMPNRDLCAIKKRNTGSNSTEVHILSADSNYQSFVLQTGTPLHETDDSFEFALASNGDLVVIKKSRTGTNSTEVHVLSATDNYQAFSLQTGTVLHETDDAFEFALASNRDLVAIKKRNTGTNSTEVHVLSAASNYQQFVLQTGTALHETDRSFTFDMTLSRDLVAIKKRNTGTRTTEIHIANLR